MSSVEEKKQKTKKKLTITISIIAVVGAAALGLVVSSLLNGFDAKAYTEGVLNQTFRGETSGMLAMVDGVTEEDLLLQYENGVKSFVDNNITGGMVTDEELQKKYDELGKSIFFKVKFHVQEAEKVNRNEYRVPVEYQAADWYASFNQAYLQELQNCNNKIEKGEYKGTPEEIESQMKTEFLNNCYTRLETLVQDISLVEKETVTFTIKKDENGVFGLDSQELAQFMVKILGLEQKQD